MSGRNITNFGSDEQADFSYLLEAIENEDITVRSVCSQHLMKTRDVRRIISNFFITFDEAAL